MKQLQLLFALLVLSLTCNAQSNEDIQNVLQLCFELAEMDANHHLNDDNIPVLVIVDSGVLPEGTSLNWFGNPVEFKTIQFIIDTGLNAYVAFDSFTISGNDASVGMSYFNKVTDEVFHFIGSFSKSGTAWVSNQN
jgi:hypothetical protein